MLALLLPYLALSTRYAVAESNGAWWLVSPSGKPFLSVGVCVVDQGTSFADYDPKNPSYAAFKHYADSRAWAEDVVTRLQNWGFNTIGAWSDAKDLRLPDAPNLNFTPILHMGSSAGAPWRDMWDPAIVATMDQVAKDQIEALKGESRVIGYFSDNEQGWWNGALWDWAWKGAGTRHKLVGLLKKDYAGSWKALVHDFDPEGAKSFGQLGKSGRLYLRPGGDGIREVHRYIEMLSTRYYALCREILKKYDPGALYLGDRYISNFYPEVARSAGHFVDVLSTNLSAYWPSGRFMPFYLPALYRAAKKPVLITEYYMCARENGSGNKNDSSGFPVVDTQKERAEGFKTSTEELLRTPYVVGAHWFQYYDEPQNGRGDGEDYDMGLVDTANHPYADLTRAAQSIDAVAIHREAPSEEPLQEAIPFAKAGDIGTRLLPSGQDDRGDAFLSWTPTGLTLTLYWEEDRFFEALYRGGKVPKAEEPVLTLGQGSVRFIGSNATAAGGISVTAFTSGVRNAATIHIPASALGKSELRDGDEIPLNLELSTRGRAYSIHWKGAYRLGSKP